MQDQRKAAVRAAIGTDETGGRGALQTLLQERTPLGRSLGKPVAKGFGFRL